MALKPGDAVHVLDREPTPDDAKSGLYYSYFANLSGKVDRVYDDGAVCVEVNLDALPERIRKRHEETEKAAKTKWLDSLSGEARGRLTEEEKQFRLSYRILVSAKDLKIGKPAKTPEKKAKSESPKSATAAQSVRKTGDETSKGKKGGATHARAPKGQAAPSKAKAPAASGAAAKPAPTKPAAPKARSAASREEVRRLTQADLDKAEAAFLAQRARGASTKPPRRTAP